MDSTLYKPVEYATGVSRRNDGLLLHLLSDFRPAKNEIESGVYLWPERFSWAGPYAISGTLPFLVTTNAIMKYNSIACKVLTELVLAPTNRH